MTLILPQRGRIRQAAAAGGFYPTDLFLASEKGFFFDMTNTSLMTQARDGTGVAPGTGDSVGLIQSAAGAASTFYISPSADSNRGTLQAGGGLILDGINDRYLGCTSNNSGIANWDLSKSSDNDATMFWVYDIDAESDTDRCLWEAGSTGVAGSSYFYPSRAAGDTLTKHCYATAAGKERYAIIDASQTVVDLQDPQTCYFEFQSDSGVNMDVTDCVVETRKNATSAGVAYSGGDATSAAYVGFGNQQHYIGLRGALANSYFKGVLYAVFLIMRRLDDTERTALESWGAALLP